jgi:GTP-binding protein
MKPVIALVGRPNVGKSTLFNRLTRSRLALVADEPGVTRDRQYGDGRIGDRPYLVVDTGGIVEDLRTRQGTDLGELVSRQTQQALAEADAIVFVTDARDGLAAGDREIADHLRRTGKPAWLAVNKCEGLDPDTTVAEFHALGLGDPYPISSAHGEGVAELMERVLARLPAVEESVMPTDLPRIAVIGRPNAGKSTLVNALLGEERVVVSDLAGTTRDAIRVPFEREGQGYVLIDTAGMRRRARVDEGIEKFSVLRTLQAIDEANVVILVLDAVAGVGEQDAVLAGYALEQGRALVFAVNKWDAVEQSARDWIKREFARKLTFAGFARVHYISALERHGLEPLFRSCREAFEAAGRHVSTPQLNRVLERAVAATPPPVVRGHRIRPKYAHQAGRYPPTFVVHGNLVGSLSKSYRRYLANTFREAFDMAGTPIRIECRDSANPYASRKPAQRSRSGRQTRKKPKR